MNEKEQAFAYIEGHRDAMMKMWEDLVMTPSGSANKADVDAIIAKAADILTGMGGKTRIKEFTDAGNALVISLLLFLLGILIPCSATRKKLKSAPLPLRTAQLTGRACWI